MTDLELWQEEEQLSRLEKYFTGAEEVSKSTSFGFGAVLAGCATYRSILSVGSTNVISSHQRVERSPRCLLELECSWHWENTSQPQRQPWGELFPGKTGVWPWTAPLLWCGMIGSRSEVSRAHGWSRQRSVCQLSSVSRLRPRSVKPCSCQCHGPGPHVGFDRKKATWPFVKNAVLLCMCSHFWSWPEHCFAVFRHDSFLTMVGRCKLSRR